jgi:hypothetical protein
MLARAPNSYSTSKNIQYFSDDFAVSRSGWGDGSLRFRGVDQRHCPEADRQPCRNKMPWLSNKQIRARCTRLLVERTSDAAGTAVEDV